MLRIKRRIKGCDMQVPYDKGESVRGLVSICPSKSLQIHLTGTDDGSQTMMSNSSCVEYYDQVWHYQQSHSSTSTMRWKFSRMHSMPNY